jgi:glycosyltransferase involved in cell wall biosynthesis
LISFIIPAHNEEALLGRTLSAMHESVKVLGEPYEIIVANDASTDGTAAIALEHRARVVAVNYRQIAATRNAGARAATGDLFFFVDADTVVTQRAVRAAVRHLRRGAVGGGSGAVHLDGRLPAYAVILMPILRVILHVAGWAPGCFLFCTRNTYLAAHGFNEAMHFGEEIDFSRRLKRQGRFVMLHESLTTSARKLRAHSALGLLRVAIMLLFRRSEGLEFWYGPRKVAH